MARNYVYPRCCDRSMRRLYLHEYGCDGGRRYTVCVGIGWLCVKCGNFKIDLKLPDKKA